MNSRDPHKTTQRQSLHYYKEQRENRLRQRQRTIIKRRILLGSVLLLCLVLIISAKIGAAHFLTANPIEAAQPLPAENGPAYIGATEVQRGYDFSATEQTVTLNDESIASTQILLINLKDNSIVAQKDAQTIISPASMTKVLTILVAAEHLQDLNDTFTISREITDYCYQHKCSAVGFSDGETVPVKDLFYGTILPSGADAAVALATYTAGSREAFIDLMNEKLDELGLSQTAHFTNCVGLYDELHYCTAADMAVIMKAALENDLCREVLSTKNYTTARTSQHPDGLNISNWFLRRIEDKETNGSVIAAKTGFVNQSGNCAVSYFLSASGTPYIAVTVNAFSSWRCIYDHVALYSTYGA